MLLRSEKANLAQIERVNAVAYQRVLATIPTAKQQELAEFLTQYHGKPLPVVQPLQSLSSVRGISIKVR